MSFNITFAAKNVKMNTKNKLVTVEVLDPIEFLTDAIMTDETLSDFLDQPRTVRFLIKFLVGKVGVKGLLNNLTEEEKRKLIHAITA